MFKNLCLVSFVGIDQQTEFEKLKNFSNKNRIYEFGILYSESKNEKDKRYPGYVFTKKYLQWARDNDVNSSLHLCGSSIDEYLSENAKVIELSNLTNRIQLNLNIKKYIDYNKLADNIINVAQKYDHKIILQKNNTKKEFNEVFLSKKQNIFLSLLNDSSGGFGKEIEQVSPPHSRYFTGYAGGINPNNVLKIINIIEKTNIDNKPYYIDMESGIREDNFFSIEKCKKIYDSINLETAFCKFFTSFGEK